MLGLGLTKFIPLFVYICFIATIILALFKNPKYNLYFVVFMIPLQSVMDRLQEFPLGKDIMDICVLTMLICVFVKKGDKDLFVDKFTNRIIYLLILSTYIALWVGSFKYGTPYPISLANENVVLWKNFIMMPLLYILAVNIVDDRREILFIIMIMVLALFLMDVKRYNVIKWMSFESYTGYKKASGSSFTYLGPNELAAFYIQMTLFLVGLAFCIKDNLKKCLLYSVSFFNMYCFIYLFSRGGYLSAIVGFFFLGVTKKKIVLVFLLILVIAWKIILPNSVVQRIEMTWSGGGLDGTSVSRLDMWSKALKSVAVNPLTGVGFGNTRKLGIKRHEGSSDVRGSVHSGYLKILVEQGLIGVCVFFMIYYVALKRGWAIYKGSNDPLFNGLGLGFITFIVANLAGNLTGDKWSYFNVMGYFWILFALVVKAEQIEKSKETLVQLSETN